MQVTPLSERTLSCVNFTNVTNNNRLSTTTKKQNNPYAAVVLPPTPTHHNNVSSLQSFVPSPFVEQQAMFSPSTAFLTPSAPSQFSRPTSFPTSNPYAAARTQLQSAPVPSPQLTKMYVDGRPVPVHKAAQSQPAPAVESALVTVAFRLHSSVFYMDMQRCCPQSVVSSLEQLNGLHVIVDGDRGEDLGRIIAAQRVSKVTDENRLCVRRIATSTEVTRLNTVIAHEEQRALQQARQEALVSLPLAESLELTDATFQFDQKKLTIWYKVPGRVYFVPLARALNQLYHCRIWMERVGGPLPEDEEPFPTVQRRPLRRQQRQLKKEETDN